MKTSIPSLGARSRLLRTVGAVVALTGSWGCVSLTAFDEVRSLAGEESYLEVDGRQVYVELGGEGEPIVLVHGLGGSAYNWREVLPRLAESYRTVVPDLAGFGYSGRPPEKASYTRSAQLRLLTGVMDALEIESAHFFGHSFGGGLVLALAYQRPERVRSMVLVDSTMPDFSTRRRPLVAWTSPLGWAFLRTVVLRPAFLRQVLRRSFYDNSLVTPEKVRETLDRLRVEGLRWTFRGMTRPVRSAADREKIPLEEIAQPALVVWGRQDRLVRLKKGRRMAEKLPRGRLVVLEQCGHSPMEEKPEEFLAEVEAFLTDAKTLGSRLR